MAQSEYNFPNSQFSLISGSTITDKYFDPSSNVHGHFVQMTLLTYPAEQNAGLRVRSDKVLEDGITPQLKVYNDESGDLYTKPNEVLDNFQISEGTYKLRFDYLKNTFSDKYCDPPSYWETLTATGQEICGDGTNTGTEGTSYFTFEQDLGPSHEQYQNPSFRVKEISPSRKEIRLMPWSDDHANPFTLNGVAGERHISNFYKLFGLVDQNAYKYDYVLDFGEQYNNSISIVNYTFDTEAEAITLILKLSRKVPTAVNILDVVQINQEVLDSQIEEINYYSNIKSPSFSGELTPYTDIELIGNYDGNLSGENYNDLYTSSFTDSTIINTIVSSSDVNLTNINYNYADSHIFFGSAVSKLENFYTKVSSIENYYTEISKSLTSTSSIYLNTWTADNTFTRAVEQDYFTDRRNELFNNIQKEISSFTPYEKFLYYDGQAETTASAPGLGTNYTKKFAVREKSDVPTNQTQFNHKLWGFNNVYKITGSITDHSGLTEIPIFKNLYRAENSPIYHYSGSVYLSFLAKDGGGASGSTFTLNNTNNQNYNNLYLPQDAFGGDFISNQGMTGSEWRRYVVQASQSYWRPTTIVNFNVANFIPGNGDWDAGSSAYQILTGSYIGSASYSGSVYDDFAYTIITPGEYQYLATTITGSGQQFTGSIMPAGDLFNIGVSTEVTKSIYITDVKVSKNNPSDVLPFAQLYKTGSNTFQTWYSSMHSSASLYDEENVNSLANNLPTYILKKDEDKVLRKFVNMQGEHFDILRNYIDNYLSFYNRSYRINESIPSNLLPILGENLGWELINPFTGSLAEYFGDSESTSFNERIKVGGNTINEIRNNTWRKLLNNLMYIYKSKGTLNSVRALLNIYGYPPDSLNLQEYGGAQETSSPFSKIRSDVLGDNVKSLERGLERSIGNISYDTRGVDFYSYYLSYGQNQHDKNFKTSWHIDGARPESIEFVIKMPQYSVTNNSQELLMSSGSVTASLWDLRLIQSKVGARVSSSLQFRLNNSLTGSLAIAANAVSMSTSYKEMRPGSLWNIALQRMTASISGTGIQEYKLYRGIQKANQGGFSLDVISMSISGGTSVDSNHIANQNWASSGSRHPLSSSNLIVGSTFSGSMAELRSWEQPLSESIIKSHIINKIGTVGNSFDSSMNELIYHYRLNENWASASISSSNFTPKLFDSNPNGPSSNPTDYSIDLNATDITSSVVYDHDIINIYRLTIIQGGDEENTNQIIIKPDEKPLKNLNPRKKSVRSLYDQYDENKRRIFNTKIGFSRSPDDILNSFYLNNLSGFKLTDKFGDPRDFYEDRYGDLEKFKKKFDEHFKIEYKINKYIREQARLTNNFLEDAIRKLAPARAHIDPFNIVLKPTILERSKFKHHKLQISDSSPLLSDILVSVVGEGFNIEEKLAEFDVNKQIIADSEYVKYKKSYINVNNQVLLSESEYVIYKNVIFDVNKQIDISDSEYVENKKAEYLVDVDVDSIYTLNYKLNIDVDSIIDKSGVQFNAHSSLIPLSNYLKERGELVDINLGMIKIKELIKEDASYELPRISEFNVHDNIVKEAEKVLDMNHTFDVMNQIKQTSEKLPIMDDVFNVMNIIKRDAELDLYYSDEYNVHDRIVKESEYVLVRNTLIDIIGKIKKESERVIPVEDIIEVVEDIINTAKVDSYYWGSEMDTPDRLKWLSERLKETLGLALIDIKNLIVEKAEQNLPIDDLIDINHLIKKENFILLPIKKEIDIIDPIKKESSVVLSKSKEIDIIDPIKKESSVVLSKSKEIDIIDLIKEEAAYLLFKKFEMEIIKDMDTSIIIPKSLDYSIDDLIKKYGEVIQPITGTFGADWYLGYKDPSVDYRGTGKGWGRGYDDIHFLPKAVRRFYGPDAIQSNSAYLGSGMHGIRFLTDQYFNVSHYEKRYIFNSIGDTEVISASAADYIISTSVGKAGSPSHKGKYFVPKIQPMPSYGAVTDFNDPKYFLRRDYRDKGKGYTYKSHNFHSSGSMGSGAKRFDLIDGRPSTITAYYTSSNDTLIYPSNHWIHFGRASQFFNHLWYDGTQNTDPGFWPIPEVEDLSSASFYRVKVTGQDQVVTRRGRITIDKNNNIIRNRKK